MTIRPRLFLADRTAYAKALRWEGVYLVFRSQVEAWYVHDGGRGGREQRVRSERKAEAGSEKVLSSTVWSLDFMLREGF